MKLFWQELSVNWSLVASVECRAMEGQMKIHWILCVCSFLCVCEMSSGRLFSQNLHAVVVGDTSPAAEWGVYTPNVQMDVTSINGMLEDNMPKKQLDIVRLLIDQDESSSPQVILGLIGKLKPSPEDTVLFYFSGHGGSDDQGHYLALAKGKLYRQQLIEALRAKGARVTVLLTDCCNVRSDGNRFMAPDYLSKKPTSPSLLFRSLLLEPRGFVDINSSSPGESAFFTPLSISFAIGTKDGSNCQPNNHVLL